MSAISKKINARRSRVRVQAPKDKKQYKNETDEDYASDSDSGENELIIRTKGRRNAAADVKQTAADEQKTAVAKPVAAPSATDAVLAQLIKQQQEQNESIVAMMQAVAASAQKPKRQRRARAVQPQYEEEEYYEDDGADAQYDEQPEYVPEELPSAAAKPRGRPRAAKPRSVLGEKIAAKTSSRAPRNDAPQQRASSSRGNIASAPQPPVACWFAR